MFIYFILVIQEIAYREAYFKIINETKCFLVILKLFSIPENNNKCKNKLTKSYRQNKFSLDAISLSLVYINKA